MPRTPKTLAIGATVLVLAACSSSPTASSTSSTTSVASTSAATSPASTSPASTSPTAASTPAATTAQAVSQTSLDPCQLVTRAEASALASATFAAGKEEAFGGGGKGCVYGAQTLNVFTVEVAQASDPAAAQAAWSTEQARAQAALKQGAPAGAPVTLKAAPLSGLGDRAATATATAKIAGQTISISGIYVLKGAVFFAFQDLVLGRAAPATGALRSEATTVLGRLP